MFSFGDRLDHRKPSPNRPLGVVLVRLGIAEIRQYPIAHVLGDEAAVAARSSSRSICDRPR